MWVNSAHLLVGELVTYYQAYRTEVTVTERSFAEYAFELLVLGVLLRMHGAQSENLPTWIKKSLAGLLSLQNRYPWTTKPGKTIRGILWELARYIPLALRPSTLSAVERVELLLEWMKAADYTTQKQRLDEWQSYLKTVPPVIAEEIVLKSLKLADEFAISSQQSLGAYTSGVSRYLRQEASRRRWHYDINFVSREAIEYHLGMLGTQLLSQAYRNKYLGTSFKVVILPPCMRAQPDDHCRALSTPNGSHCQHCTPGCPISSVTRLGEAKGFEVYTIPDDMRTFKSASSSGQNKFGVVGVSCALTNWSGGWDLENDGIPGQGMLLDFVGCKYHWDRRGISTEINLQHLQEIIHGQDRLEDL
jgi:uncharacterized protein